MEYFNELLNINKKIIETENNVILENLKRMYPRLEDFYNQDFNLEDFIKLCIRLFNAQIFKDGNSRTIYTYLSQGVEKNGYYIDFEKVKANFSNLRTFFPILYNLDEEITVNMVNRIKKYIHVVHEEKKGVKR